MKRLMLVFVMILCLVPVCGWAETTANVTFVCGDFEYILMDDGTAEITAYSGGAVDLVVPGVLDGKPVSTIGDMAFAFNSNLTNVTIPDGVICIDDEAFAGCRNLTCVTIPDSVTGIGYGAFR